MLMTESEALQKRCTPSLVVLLLDQSVRNGLAAGGLQVGSTCIGSKCALWCWYDYVVKDGLTYFEKGEPVERASFHKGKAYPLKTVECEARPGRGFCGLTGSRE